MPRHGVARIDFWAGAQAHSARQERSLLYSFRRSATCSGRAALAVAEWSVLLALPPAGDWGRNAPVGRRQRRTER